MGANKGTKDATKHKIQSVNLGVAMKACQNVVDSTDRLQELVPSATLKELKEFQGYVSSMLEQAITKKH